MATDLSAWQARLLQQVMQPGPWRVSVQIGRANGRRTADCYALAAALAFGHHVHVLARDGLWCVNRTDIGPLWERLRERN